MLILYFLSVVAVLGDIPQFSREWSTIVSYNAGASLDGNSRNLRGGVSGQEEGFSFLTYAVSSSSLYNATSTKIVSFPFSSFSVISLFSPRVSMECYVNDQKKCLFFCPLGGESQASGSSLQRARAHTRAI